MQNASITVPVAIAAISASRRRIRGRPVPAFPAPSAVPAIALAAACTAAPGLIPVDVRVNQPDAYPVDRAQVAGLRRRLTELLAQPRQVHIDRVIRAAVRLVPYLGQQLALGDDPAAAGRERVQQVELLPVQA